MRFLKILFQLCLRESLGEGGPGAGAHGVGVEGNAGALHGRLPRPPSGATVGSISDLVPQVVVGGEGVTGTEMCWKEQHGQLLVYREVGVDN